MGEAISRNNLFRMLDLGLTRGHIKAETGCIGKRSVLVPEMVGDEFKTGSISGAHLDPDAGAGVGLGWGWGGAILAEGYLSQQSISSV
jgi:hypothetical protein